MPYDSREPHCGERFPHQFEIVSRHLGIRNHERIRLPQPLAAKRFAERGKQARADEHVVTAWTKID